MTMQQVQKSFQMGFRYITHATTGYREM